MTWISGASILLVVFLDSYDVLSTNVFSTAVAGTIEITESTMVMVVFGGLAYTQLSRGHIRMELVYIQMKPRGKVVMDLVSELVAIAYFIALFWTSMGEAVNSWSLLEISVGLIQYPIYPVRTVLVLGLGILLCQLVLDVTDHVSMLRGKIPIKTVDQLIPIE